VQIDAAQFEPALRALDDALDAAPAPAGDDKPRAEQRDARRLHRDVNNSGAATGDNGSQTA